jgi:hypothetical protein
MRKSVTVPTVAFSNYFLEALKTPLPDIEPRIPRLRVSSVPVCGLKMADTKMVGHVEPDSDAMKEYYCGVGTAAHTVFQRFTSVGGKIYGDWKCRNRDCLYIVRFGCDHKCPKCGSEMEYEEFTVKLFRHVSGHTDGLFQDRHGKFWVIDYKTSSVKAVMSQKKYPTFPYSKNKAQIEAYVVMLEEEFGIKVEGWMLIYVARDNPTIHKVVGDRMLESDKQKTYEQIHLFDRQYHKVVYLKSMSQLRFLERTKLCRDREHYESDIKGFEPCPLESVCFSKRLPSFLEATFHEYITP